MGVSKRAAGSRISGWGGQLRKERGGDSMPSNRGTGWLRRRVGRRTTLRAGAAGAGLAAVYLAACGGGDNKGGSNTEAGKQQLITATAQAATSKQPKPGGSLSAQLT